MAATETLLVVENEAAIKTLVQMALERHGYVVLTAESGSEALRLAAAHQGPIDLLITDVVMPDLRGPDLARRLIEQRPALATLFMSGYMDDALGDDTSSLPVPVDFIQKPFSPSALAARVREMLDRRRAHPRGARHDTSPRPLPRARPRVDGASVIRTADQPTNRRPLSGQHLDADHVRAGRQRWTAGARPNPRGLLVLDAAGHAFEFVTSSATQRIAGGQVPVADAPAASRGYGGFWGQLPRRSRRRRRSPIAPKAASPADWRQGVLAIVRARGEPPDDHVRR